MLVTLTMEAKERRCASFVISCFQDEDFEEAKSPPIQWRARKREGAPPNSSNVIRFLLLQSETIKNYYFFIFSISIFIFIFIFIIIFIIIFFIFFIFAHHLLPSNFIFFSFPTSFFFIFNFIFFHFQLHFSFQSSFFHLEPDLLMLGNYFLQIWKQCPMIWKQFVSHDLGAVPCNFGRSLT